MRKIAFTAVLIAVAVALTPAGVFAKGGKVSGSINKNYESTVPYQENAPGNAHRYYGGPQSSIPHGSERAW
jgi:hypothetical protein